MKVLVIRANGYIGRHVVKAVKNREKLTEKEYNNHE